MKRIESGLVLAILSACLGSSAFWWPQLFGGAVVFMPIFLFMALQRLPRWWCALMWAVLFFTLHFTWLYQMLVTNTTGSVVAAVIFFILIMCNFVGAATLWGCVYLYGATFTRLLLLRVVWFCCSFGLLWHWILTHSLWFLSCMNGYPFLNLLLPLVNWKYTPALLIGLLSQFPAEQHVDVARFKCYATPLESSLFSTAQNTGRTTSIEMRIQALAKVVRLVSKNLSDVDCTLILPESSFSYCLQWHPELLERLTTFLSPKTELIFGTLHKHVGGQCQSLAVVRNGKLQGFIDKTQLFDFSETIPAWAETLPWARDLLGCTTPLRHVTEEQGLKHRQKLAGGHVASFFLCSEFFSATHAQLHTKSAGSDFVVVAVNDSWFTPAFKDSMAQLAALRSMQLGLPLLYVAHSRAGWFAGTKTVVRVGKSGFLV